MDQLSGIALLMDINHVHELTDNARTIECVVKLLEGIRDAWIIMDDIQQTDNEEQINEWQNKWEDVFCEMNKKKESVL